VFWVDLSPETLEPTRDGERCVKPPRLHGGMARGRGREQVGEHYPFSMRWCLLRRRRARPLYPACPHNAEQGDLGGGRAAGA
jgi:hypothetical protein